MCNPFHLPSNGACSKNNTQVEFDVTQRQKPQRNAFDLSVVAHDEKVVFVGSQLKKPVTMLYVLLLEHGKFYVGFTDQEDDSRIRQHAIGNGSAWTRKYPPVEKNCVVEHRKGNAGADEDALTLHYMEQYSWINVRGGRWCQVNMTKPPPELGMRLPVPLSELKHRPEPMNPTPHVKAAETEDTNEEETKKDDHDKAPMDAELSDKEPEEGEDDLSDKVPEPQQTCFTCHKPGHFMADCPEQVCFGCGKKGHAQAKCPRAKCWKCGNYGHIKINCPGASQST